MKKIFAFISVGAALLCAAMSSCSPKEAKEYTITITNKGNGTAVADKPKAAGGATITLTATPAESASFKQWTVVAGEATIKEPAAASTTFIMPAADVEITAEFSGSQADKYTVTVTNDGNGTAIADVDNAAQGETVALTATPAEGAAFKQWTVTSGGATINDPAAASTIFTMPAADVNITAEFTGGTNVAVTGVKLNFTETTRIRNTTFTLRPTILPADATNKKVLWTSLDPDIASVDAEGVVTALASGIVAIRVKTVDGNITTECTLTVEKTCGCEEITVDDPGTVTFITNKTWTVGNQIWSDAVTATRCQKDTYKGGKIWQEVNDFGKFRTDCRSNPGYGDLFSWCAVIRFQNKLCPEGWRVPTKEEFVTLDFALGGIGALREFEDATVLEATYLHADVWGGMLGGIASCHDGALWDQREKAVYWASTENTENGNGHLLYIRHSSPYGDKPSVSPVDFDSLFDDGFMLRCVKDK